MVQQTPPYKSDLNWKLKVLDRIQRQTAREIAAHLGMPESTLSYHLQKWKKLDVIRKAGYGTWEVNQDKRHLVLQPTKRAVKGPKQLRKTDPCRSTGKGGVDTKKFVVVSREGDKLVRQDSVGSHGFMFVLSLPTLTRWNQRGRRKYLEKKGIDHVPIQQGERLDEKLTLGWKVHLTNKSLVAYAPKGERWYVDRADEGAREITFEFLRVVKRVEGLMGVQLQMQGRYKFKVTREHHALIANALADQYTKQGKKLYLRDERGLWGLIDASFLPEFETVRAGPDGRDANRKVQDFFNGVKDTGITPKQILEMIHGLAENAQVFGINHAQHVKVLERMDATLKKLNEWMEANK